MRQKTEPMTMQRVYADRTTALCAAAWQTSQAEALHNEPRRKGELRRGDVFHDLTVVREVDSVQGLGRTYLCQCKCGGSKEVPANRLRSGAVKSCGCRFVRQFHMEPTDLEARGLK